MYPKKINYLIIMLAVILWLFTPGIGAAEDDNAGIEKIKPARGFDAGEMDYVEAAKRKFSAIGTLDAVYEDRVVVGDASCELAGSSDLSGVSVGDFVGVKTNSAGKAVKLERLDPDTFKRPEGRSAAGRR